MANIMKLICVFSSLLLFYGCGMNSRNKEEATTMHVVDSIHDYSNKYRIIPPDYQNTIEGSSAIEWMLLDAFSDMPDTTLLIGGGEVLSRKIDYAKETIAAVVSTLIRKDAFPASDHVKESTFMPDLAMRFVYKRDTVVVAYSFYCDLCRFQKGYKYVDYDGENIRNEILNVSLEIFPNDKYLRELKRKNK